MTDLKRKLKRAEAQTEAHMARQLAEALAWLWANTTPEERKAVRHRLAYKAGQLTAYTGDDQRAVVGVVEKMPAHLVMFGWLRRGLLD